MADYGRELHYACPVYPCSVKRVVRWENAQELHEGPLVVLRLGHDVGEHPHPVPAVRDLLEGAEAFFLAHLDSHTAVEWLVAAQAQEDLQEEVCGQQNQETERAWANARSAQQSLLEARQEVSDLKLALSHQQGALASVREITAHMRGMMITPDLVNGSVAALLQIVGTDEDDAVPTYVQAVRRLSALEDARTAILRYLDLFDDTADGLRRTVQAFLGEMPHQHDQVASSLANLRTTIRELEHAEFGPQNAARLWMTVTAFVSALDHPATSPEEITHGNAH